MFHVDSLIMDIFYILEQFIALFNLQQVKVFKTWSKDREWNISAVKKRCTTQHLFDIFRIDIFKELFIGKVILMKIVTVTQMSIIKAIDILQGYKNTFTLCI